MTLSFEYLAVASTLRRWRRPTINTLFIPGVTMPRAVTSAFGIKNVGNIFGVAQTLYLGAQGSGIVQIPTGTYDNIDFGDRILDIRGTVTMNNCKGTLVNNGTVTSINAHCENLNGISVVMNDCEWENRSQRIINGWVGRNFVFNRCIWRGGYVDGVNNANTGSAPQTSGGEINDCVIMDFAVWTVPGVNGAVHSSDDVTHNDGTQIQLMPGFKATNCFYGMWVSDLVGTGTPNSGNEINPHAATYPAYLNFTQATMEGWRNTMLATSSPASQSFDGVSRKWVTGGSFAGIMCNTSTGIVTDATITRCWFSGGGVGINATSTALTGQVATMTKSTFWNDMALSSGRAAATKGIAYLGRTGGTPARVHTVPTAGVDQNLWFDGLTVTPTMIV